MARAGQALAAPGAAVSVGSAVMLLGREGPTGWEYVAFLVAGLSLLAAGVGLWRRAGWGRMVAKAGAALWALAAIAVVAMTVGDMGLAGLLPALIYCGGPVLLCAGVALATRGGPQEAPPPPPRRRLMRGGAH